MVLKLIISSGQTGAEQGALDAAIKYNFPHGGWITKGRMTEDGTLPERFDLNEMPTKSYSKRAEKNLLSSDGTMVISHGKFTGSSALTRELAKKHNRPFLHLDLNVTPAFIATSEINSWIIEHEIEILNVTGSSGSEDPDIYNDAMYVIEGVILLGLVQAQAGSLVTDHHIGDYLEKLPIPPKTVDEAVGRLISDLDLKDKVLIANMDLDELVNLHSSLHTYLKNAFGLWSENTELMESCRSISKNPVNSEVDATAVIIGVFWEKLNKEYKLRIVK
ncbi:MAG: putative molybdenum carrier protein [Desulfobacterales bacterium]|nr:MAG: putative molybdenum carrier protein [Desulfobacterales bacterium]